MSNRSKDRKSVFRMRAETCYLLSIQHR